MKFVSPKEEFAVCFLLQMIMHQFRTSLPLPFVENYSACLSAFQNDFVMAYIDVNLLL